MSFFRILRMIVETIFAIAGYIGFITLIFFALGAWDVPLWRVGIACALIHGYAIYYEFVSRHKEDN